MLTQQYLIGGAMRFGNLADEARFAAVSQELFAEYQARVSAPERHFMKMFADTNMSLAYMVSMPRWNVVVTPGTWPSARCHHRSTKP